MSDRELTDDEVRAIRKASQQPGANMAEIGRFYDVSRQTIGRVRRGLIGAKVTDTAELAVKRAALRVEYAKHPHHECAFMPGGPCLPGECQGSVL